MTNKVISLYLVCLGISNPIKMRIFVLQYSYVINLIINVNFELLMELQTSQKDFNTRKTSRNNYDDFEKFVFVNNEHQFLLANYLCKAMKIRKNLLFESNQ